MSENTPQFSEKMSTFKHSKIASYTIYVLPNRQFLFERTRTQLASISSRAWNLREARKPPKAADSANFNFPLLTNQIERQISSPCAHAHFNACRPSPSLDAKTEGRGWFAMLVGALVVALALFCCSAVSAGDEWTEQQVQQSKQWKNGRAPLVFTKSGLAWGVLKVAANGCRVADLTAVV